MRSDDASQGAMTPALSVYLDLIRFGAALVVVFSHCWLIFFPGLPLHWPGPGAVIVFFVLSGFVIAYVTDGRDRTLGGYALNRLSRLWSVSIPALCFGLALFPFVQHSAFGPLPADSLPALGSALNAAFLGEVWFSSVAPPLNGPFWSINYEAWFYAIFGAWTYLPRPVKGPAACALAALAGPKILLLMPCWLFGVFAYRTLGRRDWSERTALWVWLLTGAAGALLVKSAVPTLLHDLFRARWPETASPLAYSGFPLTDYPLAFLVALNFTAAAQMRSAGRVLLRFARVIRACASYTLTIYLFHLPLLVLFWDVLRFPPWACCLSVAASIVIIGTVTEHRRRSVRAFLSALLLRPLPPLRADPAPPGY
jgi:peptidoglycan/LPS O-acetylase OafA/YrhL